MTVPRPEGAAARTSGRPHRPLPPRFPELVATPAESAEPAPGQPDPAAPDRFAVHLVAPDLSAVRTITLPQRLTVLLVAAILLAALVLRPLGTLTALVGIATLMYVLAFGYRMWLFRMSLDDAEVIRISDEDARAVPAWRLPIYTILIPAYKEPEVIGHLIESVGALEYPRERLDVKLLLEEDDLETY